MKSKIFVLMSTITVFAVLGVRIRVAAQDQQEQKAIQPHLYTITALSALGGTLVVVNDVNNKGWVAVDTKLASKRTANSLKPSALPCSSQ